MRHTLISTCALAAFLSVPAAQAQSNSRLFLVGTEPANADMTFVELAWLPSVTAVAPGLTGVLERDPRIPVVLEECAEAEDFPLLVNQAANTFGGFAIRLGFDAAQNAGFESYLTCALDALKTLEPDDEVFLEIQGGYYNDISYLDYTFSLMTEFGYGLAREEFADPVPRPSELFSLALQDYRGAWPALFDSSDLYATAVSPSGVTDILVAIDNQIDKDYGRPEQAVLPEQPPYNAATLEGLGLKIPGVQRTFFQVNRVFAPSIEASISEGRIFDFIIDQRLDTFRQNQGLDPSLDAFRPLEPVEEGEEVEEPPIPETGLWGIRSSFFADRKYVAAFTFMSVYVDPQAMAPTVDLTIEALETAMASPFTQDEFDAAVADLAEGYCALEPTEGMAQTQGVWLREDLFHGRARSFVANDVMGCEGLTLERANEIRELTLNDSATLVYGFGGIVEDAETLNRPFCIVEDPGQLEFECSGSEFQL